MRERRHSFNKRPFYKKRRYSLPKDKRYKTKKIPYSKKNRRFTQPAEQHVFEMFLKSIWSAATWPFAKLRAKTSKLPELNKEKIKKWWHDIEEMERKNDFRGAVIESDKIFFYCLKYMNFEGDTFAQKLKNARTRFSTTTYNNLWQAHRARNRIVHEAEHEINSMEAINTKKKFHNGLKELGVL